MLASRGWVHLSRDLAGAVNKFHEHCDCQIVPSWVKGKNAAMSAHLEGYDPDALYGRYLEARKALETKHGKYISITDQMVAEKMAELQPAWYTDGVLVDKPDGASRDGTLHFAKWAETRLRVERQANALGAGLPEGSRLLPDEPAVLPSSWPKDGPALTSSAWNHILFGEWKHGRLRGGHAPGYGWVAGGEEFPSSWDEADIASAIAAVVQGSEPQRVIEADVRGIRIRVVTEGSGAAWRVRSAFPVRGVL